MRTPGKFKKSLWGLLGAFFLAFLAALPVSAQFTQVSGTVTDPNSLPYSNGTINPIFVRSTGSPTLSGLPYTPPTEPTSLDGSGSFTLSLADNNVLLPAGSQWQFRVCGRAIPPPMGFGGAPCFTSSAITITGASQSITAQLNAAAVAQTRPLSATGVVLATAFGVQTTGFYIPDATTAVGSPTVTCPNNDCNFSASIHNGMIAWVTNTSGSGGAGTLDCPQSSVTVNGPQSITLSNNCTAAHAANGFLIVGNKQTTALQAAWNASAGSVKGGILQLPCNAVLLIDKGIGGGLSTQPPANNYGVQGCGVSSTLIVPTPDFDTTTCLFSATRNCLFFNPAGSALLVQSYLANFMFNGFGLTTANGVANPALATTIFQTAGGNGTQILNVDTQGWLNSAANLTSFNVTNFSSLYGVAISSVGAVGLNCNGTDITLNQTTLEIGGTAGIIVAGAATQVSSFHLYNVSGNGFTPTVRVDAGTYSGYGDQSTSGGYTVNGGTLNLTDSVVSGNTATSNPTNAAPLSVTAGTVNVKASSFTNVFGGPNSFGMVQSGGTINDLGGNTWSGVNGQFSKTGGVFTGSASITGTAQTVVNVALTSGWGTANVNTIIANSDSHKATWTVSVTAGVPAASPVITYTFPTAFLVPPFCLLQQQGGTFGVLTNPIITTTATVGTFTWSGTPVVGQSYIFTLRCD